MVAAKIGACAAGEALSAPPQPASRVARILLMAIMRILLFCFLYILVSRRTVNRVL